MAALAAATVLVFVFCRGCAAEAVYPVERAKLSLSRRFGLRLAGLWRGAAANAENARLRREVASLAVMRGDVERLEAENARLRSLLGYVERSKGRWVAAAVLSEGGGAAGVRRTIRLDRGSLAGVRKDAAVMVPEGLVGRVVAVTPHTSEVRLATDPALAVACSVEGAAGVSGVLSGGSDDLLALRYLKGVGPSGLPARARVLTSGRGGVFPAGIPVGVLLETRDDSRGLSKEGVVQPIVDYLTLEDVFIRCEK